MLTSPCFLITPHCSMSLKELNSNHHFSYSQFYNIEMSDQNSEWDQQAEKGKPARKFQCNVCKKRFKNQIQLTIHGRKHLDSNSPSFQQKADKASRGRPKQFQFKHLINSEMDNPLLELIQLRKEQEKSFKLFTNARQNYEREAVWRLMCKYCDTKEEEQLLMNKQEKIFQITLGKGLALLIKEITNIIKEQSYRDELILLVTIYISYVIEETEDQNVLSNGNAGLLPQFANIFVIHDLAKRCERFKIIGTWISDQVEVIKVLNLFFRWLKYKKFTHTTATVNEQFHQEIKM